MAELKFKKEVNNMLDRHVLTTSTITEVTFLPWLQAYLVGW